MKKTRISDNWVLSAPGTDGPVPVSLPNDYAIRQPRDAHTPGGASHGFFRGGAGTYVRFLTLHDKKHYILHPDGAYMCSHITFNENLLAIHPHGYTPFLLDLTEHCFSDRPNKLVIETNDMQPSSRWYSGAGLYRDVYLWEGGDIRVEPWDLFVTTPSADGDILVHGTITSDRDAEISLSLTAADAEGRISASLTVSLSVGKGKTDGTWVLHIAEPRLWSPDSPYLYTLHAELSEKGSLTDTYETSFGIRTLSADAVHGLLLNGKPIKLRGGCLHHDHGVLGAAAWPDAELRRLSRLKEAGFNAVRSAHNPPSSSMLDICDRIGLLVMDEAFDMWMKPKSASDYHLWFADWWERDLALMVRRDRAHPSVISYSVGNEVPESSGIGDGGAWAKRLAECIRAYDNTRLVSVSAWGVPFTPHAEDPQAYRDAQSEQFLLPGDDAGQTEGWAKRTADLFAPMDIAGYNYLFERCPGDHLRFPNRVIWNSETHALHFYDSWQTVLDCPHVIGDFTWTAWDNMGEAGTGRSAWERDGTIRGISLAGWPWRTCYQGDFDLCGYRRPQSYFRKSVWFPDTELQIFTTHPEHFGEGFSGTGWHWYDVLDSWTFENQYLGHPVRCEVYTGADLVIFTLNGKEAGRAVPEKNIAFCSIPYEKGILRADAYRNGVLVGTSELRTVSSPAKIMLSPETDCFSADGRSLCYIDVIIADKDGNRIPFAKHPLHCTADGGHLHGIFSADPENEDFYSSADCHAFEGRAVLIVSAEQQGTLSVTVSSEGLTDGTVSVIAENP